MSKRVFIDSSVIIAASISATGRARDLLMMGLHDEISLVCSHLVLDETERNLQRKAAQAVPAFHLLREILDLEIVQPSTAMIEGCARLIHIKDAPIVAAAVQAQVQWIASYDRRHLLSQRDVILQDLGITVATPDEILDA